ncbi:TetR family transcriptional regulator [Streptomyces sp. NPDC006632]|uniref:TetR family transcriptional regulator n=1 Tax=unclassified Streptomyces TaxID=2593676 RepID=UPI002E1E849A
MQERAARTRQALIRAAAQEFDHSGYTAASLSGISRTAGTTVGAVTFHFSSKAELAEAVHAQGVAATRRAVQRVDRQASPLRTAIAIAVAVVRCLENDVEVRAAARLDHDHAGDGASWTSAWATSMEEELAQGTDTMTRAGAEPSLVLALAMYLVHGAEADLRSQPAAGLRKARSGGVSDLVTRMWEAILPAVEPCAGARPSGS